MQPRRATVTAPVVTQPTGKLTLVERVKRILSDGSPLSQEELFILTQVHLICLFRRATSESRRRKNTQYIIKREEGYLARNKGKEGSLTPQDFMSLNQWIATQDSTDKQRTKLEALIKKVKQRKKQAKREARIKKK